ncbi:ornithine decarboxylase 1-like [Calliopsis andreniformis]|uniref:ornithine decarboxylase 1-like n=1 Tax=Calliopsis andreniformis TaxID=337506 RepID=UPI003FCDBBDF
MSHFNFDKIKQFDDSMKDTDIIKTIIKLRNREGAFCILDIADIVQKHQNWITKMPRVVPYYAIKCNPNPTVIKILAAMNGSFDCASKQEIKQVMKYGVPGERIIFANPAKLPSHIRFAKKLNIERMTADSEAELLKISKIFPTAKVVIRIRCDAKISNISFGMKFGCDPDKEAVRLIRLTKSLGLTLHGFSFHVGSPCGELQAYRRGISICKRLISIAKRLDCKDIHLIDIGGGFPGHIGYQIDDLASIINDSIKDIDPSIKIISEPGQYYVTSAFTLVSYIHTKKIVPIEREMVQMYYINCGVYNSFLDELLNLKSRIPIPLYQPSSEKKFLSFVWGPTLDSIDCVLKNVMLPEFNIGDWLMWQNMGAYSVSFSITFNGYKTPTIYPFVRKSHWEGIASYLQSNEDLFSGI